MQEEEEKTEACWTVCIECQGRGKMSQRARRYVRFRHQQAMDAFEKNQEAGAVPVRPKSSLQPCGNCDASGLTRASAFCGADTKNYPDIAIIGGGIGGMALAVACLHRGIPFTLYERDSSFDARAQGYGLTLQQASRAMKGLGILSLAEGVYSTSHVVHNTKGDVLSEWGMRNRMHTGAKANPKRTNVHIARQALREALLEQLGGKDAVQWGHQLTAYKDAADGGVDLNFRVNGELQSKHADLVVGADGIRSVVRSLLIGEEATPLRYLDYIVILGICPIADLEGVESLLLDGATVFQTVNGTERIYVMPYAADTVMWQLSFPMSEKEAQDLSAQGPQALKDEACRRTQWHSPVPQIVAATPVGYISGYPVYDRELITAGVLAKSDYVTLIGDAAHPMSPFKGQGANQALLDALALARGIVNACRPLSDWKAVGLRKTVLNDFESEMLERSASKVKDSAEAVQLLHSKVVLREGDAPKGRSLKGKSNPYSPR